MLSTCLDIFEARLPEKNVGQDFGLLQAIDERLAMYGWLTNTGVKLVIIVDMEARQSSVNDTRTPPVLGLKNSDLTPVSFAIRLTCSVNADHLSLVKGFPRIAESIHQSVEESFLLARRSLSQCQCTPVSCIHSNHQSQIYQ
jgi:hypothetical protein